MGKQKSRKSKPKRKSRKKSSPRQRFYRSFVKKCGGVKKAAYHWKRLSEAQKKAGARRFAKSSWK